MNICLLGSAPSSVRLAPYGNKDWLFFGCSPGVYGVAPRTDVWFELHRWEPGQAWFSQEYCDFIRNYPGPVWMAEPVDGVKNCQTLPVKEMVEKYSPYFFTSSLSWMFAMAIDAIEEEWKEQDNAGIPRSHSKIALYGVDMAATEEWMWQRPGCHFFALLAKSKGIEVGVPPESDLLRPPPLYGVCEVSHAWIKQTARRREITQRINEANALIAQKNVEVQCLHGCVDDMNWHQNTWLGGLDSMGRTFVEPPAVPALTDLRYPKMTAGPSAAYELAPTQKKWFGDAPTKPILDERPSDEQFLRAIKKLNDAPVDVTSYTQKEEKKA